MIKPVQTAIALMEQGVFPDWLTRAAIRRLCQERLRTIGLGETEPLDQLELSGGPIAIETEAANRQHYELPAEFFRLVLGPRRKYSCCYFENGCARLDEAEDAALAMTCQRAELADGQSILELGCGWGSLSLWMAQCYPHSQIVAVSNSASQRRFIEAEIAARRLSNLRVVTADINVFVAPPKSFDRVVSVEMFEHVRNHRKLLERIARWLRADGKLFVHVFCHRDATYPFDTEGAGNWMGRYFFTGGIMPSAHLLREFPEIMPVTAQYTWNGMNYQRTAEAWLANLDSNRAQVMPILAGVYGAAEARIWYHRWRVFFLAVSELFGYRGGKEWFVSHYLLKPVVTPKTQLAGALKSRGAEEIGGGWNVEGMTDELHGPGSRAT